MHLAALCSDVPSGTHSFVDIESTLCSADVSLDENKQGSTFCITLFALGSAAKFQMIGISVSNKTSLLNVIH